MKGYVHDIELDDGTDGETPKSDCQILGKCYRSYKKSETPNKLLMDIDIENKVVTHVMCCHACMHARSGIPGRVCKFMY